MKFPGPNLPLEDVIREVIRSESEPGVLRLVKWTAYYPHYEEDLKEFFSKWKESEKAADRLADQTPRQPPSVIAKQLALRHMRDEGRLPQADDVFRNRKGTVFFGITAAGGRALGTSDIPIPQGLLEEEPVDDEELPANEDLEVILMEMHGEFKVPSYENLVRMCGRYPQYVKQLMDDFLGEAVSSIQHDEPQRLVELTQEERLSDALDFRSNRDKEFLLEIMKRQGLAMPPPPVTSLDAFDRHVLEAVYQLRGPRELGEIHRKVARLTGVPVLPAAISVSVNRLEPAATHSCMCVLVPIGKPNCAAYASA